MREGGVGRAATVTEDVIERMETLLDAKLRQSMMMRFALLYLWLCNPNIDNTENLVAEVKVFILAWLC